MSCESWSAMHATSLLLAKVEYLVAFLPHLPGEQPFLISSLVCRLSSCCCHVRLLLIPDRSGLAGIWSAL